MSEHTPGPWVVDGEGITIGTVCTHESGVCQEITVPSVSVFKEISSPEAVANARLIAAAPEMLEVLDLIVRIIEDGVQPLQNGRIVGDIRVLLARINGHE